MTPDPFRQLTTLLPDAANTETGGHFGGTVGSIWTIGPKVHGGAMMAMCAAAARDLLTGSGMTPLAVSASYLSAPDPGPVTLDASVLKRGKRVAHVDVVLSGGGKSAVKATVTLGTPDSADPTYVVDSSLSALPVEPPPSASPMIEGHPMAKIVHIAQGCDMRIDESSAAFLSGTLGEPEIRMWVRPRPDDEADPATAALFAIMAGDISAPVTMNRGAFGWAPTVQLTTLLRRAPAPGWLRVRAASSVIGSTWFDEDHTIIDSTGAVVVQSRQLAMVPLGG